MVRFSFDLTAAIPAAWDLCWKDNLKQRAEGRDFRGNTYHLTAADLVNQVRQFADEQAAGEAWGTRGRAWGRPCSMVRLSGDVQGAVRAWLQGQGHRGILVSHNFGKGHVSGQRYRPAGEPLTEAETATFAAKARCRERGPCWHYAKGGYGERPRCLETSTKKRAPWSRSRRPLTTNEPTKVTCARCKKIVGEVQP